MPIREGKAKLWFNTKEEQVSDIANILGWVRRQDDCLSSAAKHELRWWQLQSRLLPQKTGILPGAFRQRQERGQESNFCFYFSTKLTMFPSTSISTLLENETIPSGGNGVSTKSDGGMSALIFCWENSPSETSTPEPGSCSPTSPAFSTPLPSPSERESGSKKTIGMTRQSRTTEFTRISSTKLFPLSTADSLKKNSGRITNPAS